MKKEKKQSKSKKIIKIFLLIILLIILCVLGIAIKYVYNIRKGSNPDRNIIATHMTMQGGKRRDIKYEIQIEDFDIKRVKKTIKVENEQEVEKEYFSYERLNEARREGMEFEKKKKELIVKMSKEQFFEELKYAPEESTIVLENGEEKAHVDEFKLMKYLQSLGYTIK